MRIRFVLGIGLALTLCPPAAHAQLSPEESLAKMKTGAGLEVSLFAAEPDVINPTCIDADMDGRVWVAEGVNYRLFKNPHNRPEGDRIRILSDIDEDGRCDKATTYYQDPSLLSPLGLMVYGQRVYVCQSPDVFYLEDTNSDEVADKKTVILTGFGGKDHDHGVHGITMGLDGFLYMSVGDEGMDVTGKDGQRVWVGKGAPHGAGSIIRTDLEGEHVELVCEGLRNPYEPAIDTYGNIFISDNDDDGNEQCRIVHVFEGGNYGYWPKRRGDRKLDEVHWNEDLPGVIPKILKLGFGSPTGLMVYEGLMLPEEYKGRLIHADAGPGIVRSIKLAPKGASYSAEQETILSCPGDDWFRPSDVSQAIDGSIIVSDWYDPGVGGHNLRDWSRGRIYRLAPPGAPKAVVRENVSDRTLLDQAAHTIAFANQHLRNGAYKSFKDGEVVDGQNILGPLTIGPASLIRARTLWLLAAMGPVFSHEEIMTAARDESAELRTQAVRMIALEGADKLKELDWLLKDPEPMVRRELLLRLSRIDTDWKQPWVVDLAMAFDGEDRYYREAVGIASRGHEGEIFDKIVERTEGKWDKLFVELAFQLHPPAAVKLAGDVLSDPNRSAADRLDAVRIISVGGAGAGEMLVAQLKPETPKPIALAIMKSLGRDEGRAWPKVREDSRLREFLGTAMRDRELRPAAQTIINEMRLVDFIPELVALAKDSKLEKPDRLAAIETVQNLQSRFSLEPVKELLGDADEEIAAAAALAISALNHEDANKVLTDLLLDKTKPLTVRKETVRGLGSSKSGCLLLLSLAEQSRLTPDLILDASTATNSSPFEDVKLMAEQLLPMEQTKEGKSLPPIKELLTMQGEAKRGRETFYVENGPQCFKCHQIAGEGREVGPDLSKIGEKLAREAMFESILNPSAAVAKEYEVWIIRTNSKGYLNGYIRAESPKGIELVDATGAEIKIATSDIVEKTKSATSLMPTGLSSGMTTQQLVDLVEYLATLKPAETAK